MKLNLWMSGAFFGLAITDFFIAEFNRGGAYLLTSCVCFVLSTFSRVPKEDRP
jgi:hypothetical protein